MNRSVGAALVVAVAVLLCASAFMIIDTQDHGESYSITYELDGGTNNVQNPDSYHSNRGCVLYSPVKPGLAFGGWYTDVERTQRCDSVPAGTVGDIVLYASWTDVLEGKGFVLNVGGEIRNGPFMSYAISGTETYRYLYYDEVDDRYYMNNSSAGTYDYGSLEYPYSSSRDYWNDEGSSEYEVEQLGNETIDTVAGPKECEVFVLTHADGGVEKQWIGDGWIPYMISYSEQGFLSSTSLTYTFAKELTFETNTDPDVRIYSDEGVTTAGSGEYKPGDTVTLNASGSGFIGWYDENMSLLSSSPTYTFDIGASDLEVYALNDTDPDITVSAGEPFTLVSGMALDDAKWIVLKDGDVYAEITGTEPTYTFDEPGEYSVLIKGDIDGSEYLGYRDLRVNGIVGIVYDWKYGGESYTYELRIDYEDYLHYRNMTPVSDRIQDINGHVRDRQFVTYQDEYVVRIAEDFGRMTEGMSDYDRAGFILAFTQYIEYQSDEVFMGTEEYWKYPVETLFDNGGDCEDTSILYCAIAEAMGYDTSLLLFPGHMAAGIDLDNGKGTYFSYGQHRYFYCETTSVGFSVGDKPRDVPNESTLVPINIA